MGELLRGSTLPAHPHPEQLHFICLTSWTLHEISFENRALLLKECLKATGVALLEGARWGGWSRGQARNSGSAVGAKATVVPVPHWGVKWLTCPDFPRGRTKPKCRQTTSPSSAQNLANTGPLQQLQPPQGCLGRWWVCHLFKQPLRGWENRPGHLQCPCPLQDSKVLIPPQRRHQVNI